MQGVGGVTKVVKSGVGASGEAEESCCLNLEDSGASSGSTDVEVVLGVMWAPASCEPQWRVEVDGGTAESERSPNVQGVIRITKRDSR